MLVLSRKLGEKIYINDNICITVVDIDRGKIRLGIEAPREVPIFRQELLVDGRPLFAVWPGRCHKLRSWAMKAGNFGLWILLGLALGYSGIASAQEPSSSDEDVNARLERLEKQNQYLLHTLKNLQTSQA